ncbi:MAG: chalcone isomerase family protein [bacterium]
MLREQPAVSIRSFLDVVVKPFSMLMAAASCSVAALGVGAAGERTVSGVSLPEVITVAGKELRLNGMGLRKVKIFFSVYVIALYLEEPTQDAQKAITTDEVKRMVIVMLRDASRAQFVQSMKEGILRNSGPEMPALRERLDKLEQALPALKKGDEIDFTYLPGVGTIVHGQGREMTIQGKDFADALFSAWLGPKPLNSKLKRDLLSGPASAPATSSLSHMPSGAAKGPAHRAGNQLQQVPRFSERSADRFQDEDEVNRRGKMDAALSGKSGQPSRKPEQGPLEPSEHISSLEAARASRGGGTDAAGVGGDTDRRELVPPRLRTLAEA